MKNTIKNIKTILKNEGEKHDKYTIARFHPHLTLISVGKPQALTVVAISAYLFEEQTEDYDSDWFDRMKAVAVFHAYRSDVKKDDGKPSKLDLGNKYVWEDVVQNHCEKKGY